MRVVCPIQIKPEFLKKRDKGKIAVCPSCAEAYPLKDGSTCLACQGNSPYLVPVYAEGNAHEGKSI